MACFLPFPRLLPVFSQFPGSNKTWPPTFAASRQNSDLSPGSEPHHGAAALEEIILYADALGQDSYEGNRDEDNKE